LNGDFELRKNDPVDSVSVRLGALLLVALLSVAVRAEKPNILLVLSDDHSLPHVGAYGGNCDELGLTPTLDAFARDGMVFHRAYTASPQCAPSRAAIFAGRSPVGIAATRFAQPARAGTLFFTDLLRDHGYWVGLDGRHQHLEGRVRDSELINQTLITKGMKGPDFEERFDHFVQSWSTRRPPEEVGNRVGEVLDTVPKDKPWFLYFGFNQPHRGWGKDHEGIDPRKLQLPPDWPDLPEVRLDYARYLADVRDLDRGFGAILKVLADRGLQQNTVVIFMGDNGEALLRGKGTLHTRGIHVPLMIRWPEKVAKGSQSSVLVSGVDLAPTILATAKIEPAKGMTGKSFLDVLLGKEVKPREYVFAERGWHWGSLLNTEGFDLSRSVTTERYHYLFNAIPERTFAPVDMTRKNIAWEAVQKTHAEGRLSALHDRLYFQDRRPVFELYDLAADPFQLNNLAGRPEFEEIETSLRTQLDAWMVSEGDYLPLPSDIIRTTAGDSLRGSSEGKQASD